MVGRTQHRARRQAAFRVVPASALPGVQPTAQGLRVGRRKGQHLPGNKDPQVRVRSVEAVALIYLRQPYCRFWPAVFDAVYWKVPSNGEGET